MAKQKPDMTNIFARTDPESRQAQEATGPTITKGVGLKESEWAELQDIAAELGITQHAISAYALRHFLKQYRTGNIPLENKPTLPST